MFQSEILRPSLVIMGVHTLLELITDTVLSQELYFFNFVKYLPL
jgi:hypothetical protein